MAATDKFNGILKGRIAFEKGMKVEWGRPQYREALMFLANEEELKDFAEEMDADPLLAEAIQAYSEDAENDESLAGFRGATEVLFSPDGAALSESAVRARFTAFVSDAQKACEALTSDKDEEGMLLNIDVPTSGLDEIYPDLSLLDTQRKELAELIKLMGRQTGDESWDEWFERKFASVKARLPKLASMVVWEGLGEVVNKLLDVELIGFTIAGHTGHVVTFGANILTPWHALVEFPKLMEKQLALYRLQEYGKNKLKLTDSSKVMKAIQTTIDSIDWSAVRTGFKITPFGLLIGIYSGAKYIALKAKPEAGAYYDDAKDLIDAADTFHASGETDENKLAMLTILHLAGGPERYVQLMTYRENDAYDVLSKMMDF